MKRPTGRTANLMTGLGRQSPPRDGVHDDSPPPDVLSPEHRAMVLRGLEQARNGEFATEAEVRATFARFRT